MKISDIVEETYFSLVVNKVRTGLTMLGIVIGIGSVIGMISIGQGAQGSIESSIQSIGSNLILVMPGSQQGPGYQVSSGRGSARTLLLSDAEAIQEEISLVRAVAPENSGRYQIVGKGTNTNASVSGVTPAYADVRNVEIEEGSFITDQSVQANSKVAVLGSTVRNDLFGENSNAVGQTIRINGMEFKVVGITQSKGGGGFGSQDEMIFIPLTTAHRFLVGDSYLTTLSVQAESAESMSFVAEEITSLLLSRHKISDPSLADFRIMNQADIVATASSVTGVLTMLLSAIAGISLLVGGIGIMNMMLTTVTERTREIGLRKAIGAKRADITLQFISESIMLTVLGGVAGIVFGWLISIAMSYFAGIATSISSSSVVLAFGVSAVIGIVFGYYPARKASSMNPIDALRYE